MVKTILKYAYAPLVVLSSGLFIALNPLGGVTTIIVIVSSLLLVLLGLAGKDLADNMGWFK